MKRIIGLCLAFALAFGLVACGGQNDSKNENADAGNSVNSTTENQSQPSEQPEAEKEQEEVAEQTPVITASHSADPFKSAG